MKFVLVTLALWVCCIGAVFGESEPLYGTVCLINGERFAEGDDVGQRIDGCNNCFCSADGFGCTRMACPWYQPLDCEIEGQLYNHYDSVPSDACGECSCMNGNLACTNCPA
ncbi:unnamed protein product [Lymnaea stagnalis]|uniref:VWFC domain-containing protein n=1 Tax=Lymnaea stagnalis TaxID=6523 RepID=A0AAV2IHM5_LYMST